MSTTLPHASHAVLRLPKGTVVVLLAGARAVYAALLAETARFPNPAPTLPVFLTQTTALDAAQAATAAHTPVATAARNAARVVVRDSLRSLQGYVQGIANADAVNSVTIIKSAGFDVALPSTRTRPVLTATLPGTPGVVKLVANARSLTGGSRKRPTYNWQYSLDGGHTWVPVPGTPRATTLVTGLPGMTLVSFRVSVTLGTTQEAWSQAVTLPVH